MFTRAGFNPQHVDTGIRAISRGAPAALIRFVPSGDLAWHGRGFLAWGSACRFGQFVSCGIWPYGLPQSELRT